MLNLNKFMIRLTGNDYNIPVTLSSKNGFNGLTDGLNNFIEENTGLSINPAEDSEIVRYNTTQTVNYYFQFYDSGTTSYALSLTNAGFTADDIYTNFISKSYYTVQIYNSIKSESQKLLHIGFYNGYSFANTLSSTYTLTTDREFNSYYIKNIDITDLTGNTVYLKFSFFNAKTGKLQLFYNQLKSSDQTENIFYFDATINIANNTINAGNNLNIREYINFDYVNQINKNINVTPQERPSYPTGGTALSGNTYFIQ